jgi:hypothetical protein
MITAGCTSYGPITILNDVARLFKQFLGFIHLRILDPSYAPHNSRMAAFA